MTTSKNVTSFDIVTDHIGGYHANYGYGVCNTDYDYAVMGYGASYEDAKEDAMDQLEQEIGLGLANEHILEAGFTAEMVRQGIDPSSTDEVDEVYNDFAAEEAKSLGRELTDDERYLVCASDPIEFGLVIYIKLA